MARLWATTGDAVARLDEEGDGRRVGLFLQGTKAQCLAADPKDPDIVYVGLRESGIRKTIDGGATWHECELPEPGVFSLAVGAVDGAVYAGTEPSRLFRSDDGGEAWRELAGDTWHRADDGRDRNYTWSVAVDPDDPDCWYVSASTGPFAAHSGRDPQAQIYRRRGDEPWRALNGGLPEPLPAMPYALVATADGLFAGLANGNLWQSDDRGDTWRARSL